MKLKIYYIDVKDVRFGKETNFENGILTINKEEMIQKVNNECFSELEINLAYPGESCRISRVGDVIQPMLKLDNEEATFPGIIGEVTPMGEGETLKLRGIAVVETYEMPLPRNHFIDMSGPNAVFTPFSQTINIVITAKPIEGCEKMAYGDALKQTSLTVAKYLAQICKNAIPDEEEILSYNYNSEIELFDKDMNRLPRVVYIHQYLAASEQIEQTFYGKGYYTSLPMIFHPLEFFDGAMINKNFLQSMNADVSYFYQNHPMIKELLSRRGKDLNFSGVIYCHTPWALEEKKRNAMFAVQLAKNVLKADAVTITKEGGGHPQIDMQQLCYFCEKANIKTEISFFELNTTSGKYEEVLLFYDENVDAITSFGCLEKIELPPVDRVIGSTTFAGAPNPINEKGNVLNNWDIRGAMSQLGENYFKSIKY